MALSCIFYAKKWDACRESSESLGFFRLLCSECQEGRRRCSDAWVPSFKVRPGLNILCFFGTRAFFHFVVSLSVLCIQVVAVNWIFFDM